MDSLLIPVPADGLLSRLASAAARPGADAVEIALLGRSGEYTRFAGDRVHQPQDITETSFVARSIVDGHTARAAAGTLGGLARAVDRASACARELARRAGRSGSARLAAHDPVPELDLWHADTAAFDAGTRAGHAHRAMALAERAGGSAAGMLGRAVTQLAVVNSAGLARYAQATEALGGLTVTVADGTSHWIDLHRSVGALRIAENIERTVAGAVAGQGRVSVPDGAHTVVLGPEATGELLAFLPEFGFSGELAAAGVGLVANQPGAQVGSRLVNVADDAMAPVGLPIPFDLEGTAKQRVPLLTGGVIGAAVTDLATATALHTRATGHAHVAREEVPSPVAANLVMAPGDASEEELIAGVGRGLYVQRFWYTRLVDRVAGTITGVSRDGCFLIEDGRLSRPVAGARFTHSVLDFLSTVDGVGSMVRSQPVMNVWNGVVSAPAVRGHGFRFGAAPRSDGPTGGTGPVGRGTGPAAGSRPGKAMR